MRQSLSVFILAILGVASAQKQCLEADEAIPACAYGYLVSAASSIADCAPFDFACQCSNSAQVQEAVINTVLSQCGPSAQSVLGSEADLCSCATAHPGKSISLNSVGKSCQASYAAIPPCALGYYASAGLAVGNCDYDDFACQCSNSASIENAAVQDILSQCGSDAQSVLEGVSDLCSCVSSAEHKTVHATTTKKTVYTTTTSTKPKATSAPKTTSHYP